MLGKFSVAALIVAALTTVGCSRVSATSEEKTTTTTATVNYEMYSEVSVKILRTDGRSGGSGVILNSGIMGSTILTNKHICNIITKGGFVVKNNKNYRISQYKMYPFHDLCLIKIRNNLRVTTKVASDTPRLYDQAIVSGHPNLLPTVVAPGHFTDSEVIQIVVGFKKCDENTPDNLRGYCMFFGGIPVVEEFESVVISSQIKPGSSGSPVLTQNREIGGLVFAGSGRDFSYGFIVPHSYITHFLNIERLLSWKSVSTTVSLTDSGEDESDNKKNVEERCQTTQGQKVFQFCRTLGTTPIGYQ